MKVITNYEYNGTDTFNTVYANQDNQSILVLQADGTQKMFADLGYTTSPGTSTGTTIISVKWNDWRGFALSLPLHWTKATDTFKYGVISASNTITWHEVATTDDLVTEVNALTTKINGKANSSHNHDDRYFTESEINSKLNRKANSSHTHDDRYFTESEINAKFNKQLCHEGPIEWQGNLNKSIPQGAGNYTEVCEFTVGNDDASRYGFIETAVEFDLGSQNAQVYLLLSINDNTYSLQTGYFMANDGGRLSLSCMTWLSTSSPIQIKVAATRPITLTAYLYRVYSFRPTINATYPQ